MNVPDGLQEALTREKARLCVGYPWWLRPFMARGVIGITLGRTIYVLPSFVERAPDRFERLLRHELVHVCQVNRLGLVRFLAAYATEFLRHLYTERSIDKAYRKISFEVEAYGAEISDGEA
ncbi:MAG TPA: hypothetical protein VF618_20805 [Thermoanaerobaculia bacterium]